MNVWLLVKGVPSYQCHDIPKSNYANMACFLLLNNSNVKEFLDIAYKNSTAPILRGALFGLISIF